MSESKLQVLPPALAQINSKKFETYFIGRTDKPAHSKEQQPRIALIQPDSPYLLVPNSFPSLGLLYLSSYLKKNSYDPSFFDFTARGNDISKNNNGEIFNFDIYAFSSQITQFKDVTNMMNEIRKKNPNTFFIIGGPFTNHSPEICLEAGFDAAVVGEGEIPILEIVKSFPNMKKGKYYSADFIDPNELFPDWETIDLSRYGYQLEGKRCINILTKRGNCPFDCTFCAKQDAGDSPLRFRTAENVLEEVKMLRDKYGFGAVAIYDDEILLGKKRDKEIFLGLKKLGIPYRAMTRADLANKEDLKFLKETGCAEICVGVESADPYIHERVIEKGNDVNKCTEFVKTCKEIGLRVKTFLMIGLPSESRETIEKTKQWLREIKPENFDVSVFTPYPGSPIYHNKPSYEIDWDENYLREIWFSGKAQYDDCAVSTPHLSSKEILQIREEILSEFKRGKGGSTDYWGPLK